MPNSYATLSNDYSIMHVEGVGDFDVEGSITDRYKLCSLLDGLLNAQTIQLADGYIEVKIITPAKARVDELLVSDMPPGVSIQFLTAEGFPLSSKIPTYGKLVKLVAVLVSVEDSGDWDNAAPETDDESLTIGGVH